MQSRHALLAGLTISGSSASTAGNDLEAVKDAGEDAAGDGAATVTGATVTGISHDLDDVDPAVDLQRRTTARPRGLARPH